MEESMTGIVTSQQAMQMVLDNKMAELKTLLHRAHQAQLAQSSTRTPREEFVSKEGLTRFIRLVHQSVILPSGSPIQQSGFIEVNLIAVPTETLQVVQTQVQEEIRVREANTYRQNLKLLQTLKICAAAPKKQSTNSCRKGKNLPSCRR